MRARWWLSLGLAVALAVLGVGPAGAQDADDVLDLDEEVDVSGIEEILRGDQQVRRGEMFSYDPAGRRDPFRSLLGGFEEEDERIVDHGAEVSVCALPKYISSTSTTPPSRSQPTLTMAERNLWSIVKAVSYVNPPTCR